MAAGLVAPALWVAFAGTVLLARGRPTPTQAIFVLSGDPAGYRLEVALGLMRQTGASRLIVSVNSIGPVYDPRPDILAYVRSHGLPADELRFIGPAHSTAQEAGWAAALVRRCGWHTVALVTSPYHTRRAGWLFRRAVRGAKVNVLASHEPFHAGLWWKRAGDREIVLTEWLKGISSIGYVLRGPAARDPGVTC